MELKIFRDFLPKSCCIPQRYMFALLGFLANVIGFMIMVSLDVTISQIAVMNVTAVNEVGSCQSPEMNRSRHVNEIDYEGRYEWDEKTKQDVLGAFLMGYIWTQWPGGWAAEVFGGKHVLGACMLTASVTTLMTPVFTVVFGSDGLYYMMFISGLAVGPLVAVLISVMSKWVPKKEQNFVGTIIFPGAFIGQFSAPYLAGVLKQVAGWEVVFYTIGTLGIIWCVLWNIFCYSTPNMHPFISKDEKDYLNNNVISLIRTTKHDYDPLPWKPYFLSSAVWGLTIGYIGIEWINFVVSKQMPLYLREVYGLDIENTYFLSHSPYLCAWITALTMGFVCDVIVSREIFSLKKTRQIITATGAFGSSICLLLSFYTKCSLSMSIFWIFIAMIFFGTFYSGIILNVMDLVPNYSGNTMGVVTNLAVCSVYLLDYLQSVIVKDEIITQWRLYMWVVVICIILYTSFYLYYIQTDQLWWDDVRELGYPDNWKYGLLTTDALIDLNGQTIAKPKTKIEKSV